MAKGTGKNAAGGSKPANTDKPAAKAKEEVTETTALIPSIKAGAMSKDVGPVVIAGLAKAYDDESKANQIIEGVKAKRFDMLAQLTEACIKAAKADDTINLAVAFKDDKKGMTLLNNQLGIALGFREVTTVGEGNKTKQKIDYSKAVSKFFPSSKDDKDSPEYQRKSTTRTNFLHMLKKCAQAAHGAVVNDLGVKKDAKSGTLQITGPAVQKTFGSESVLLDDKLTVKNESGEKKLNEKPSFTALARMGAEAEGKTLTVRKDSRSTTAVDSDTAVQSVCNTLVAALGKMSGKPQPKTIEGLKAAAAAIAAKLA